MASFCIYVHEYAEHMKLETRIEHNMDYIKRGSHGRWSYRMQTDIVVVDFISVILYFLL
jgi:hypothetical protein